MTKRQKILVVTGRLAESSLRRVLNKPEISERFDVTVQVLPISVAALMTPGWVAKYITIDSEIERVILPGYCQGDLTPLRKLTSAPIEIGPRDVRQLPGYMMGEATEPVDLVSYDIEILAEINHAPRLGIESVIERAKHYSASGADVIDIGCEVDREWSDIGDCVRRLRDLGYRVSIDSMQPREILLATRAGAELVLSVNRSNIAFAADFNCEVVLIPDVAAEWQAMETQIEWLDQRGISFRIDPILEPIGFGFAASLQRYTDCRKRWPDIPMMMGIGNLTEMSEVDSAGVNLILLAICQELDIHSVLTTEVINWARSSVQECDIARRLVWHAVQEQTVPKHLDSRLVMLRDSKLDDDDVEGLSELAAQIKDWNMRIFVEAGEVHLLGGKQHFHGTDVFLLFDQLRECKPKNLTPDHAFYLGYEMMKAWTALQLGKQYHQDQALDWGFLTLEEQDRHRLRKKRNSADLPSGEE